MIDVTPFAGTLPRKSVAVFGLGISNRAAIRALIAAGVSVTAWDDSPDSFEAAAALGARLADLAQADCAAFDCLILAPGVPLTHPAPHPVVLRAREAGVPVLCDIEILAKCARGRKIVAITGTNGKSTTTALTGHILNEGGIRAAVGGNIGRAALDLDLPPEDGVIVLEISSFQMDLCPEFAPEIAVLLNITPDHIDRHGTFAGYQAAKEKIFRGPGAAIIALDDENAQAVYRKVEEAGTRALYPVSVTRPLDFGVYVQDGALFDGMPSRSLEEGGQAAVHASGSAGPPVHAFDLSVSSLPGVHNHQNAAAAFAVCRLLGLTAAEILSGMKSFPGLAHRQFLIRVLDGVAYVDDSKATNADATARALACYRSIYWIAGGRPKEGGLSGLEKYMDRIRHAFLVGEAMKPFAEWLQNQGVSYTLSGTLEAAVSAAHAMAQEGKGQPGGAGTVLLSPACASFDQFRNYEERGRRFQALAAALDAQGDPAPVSLSSSSSSSAQASAGASGPEETA